MNSKLRQFFHLAGVLMFMSATFLPGCLLLSSDPKTIATSENRKLAQWPQRPTSTKDWRKYPAAIEDYVNDHFGLRDALTTLNSRVHLALGVSPNERVVLGKEGWLFLNDFELTEQNRGAMPLSDRELKKLVNGFEHRRRLVEERDARLILMPVPDKNTVYSQYLPDHVKIVGPSRQQQFVRALADAGVPYVDTITPLLQYRGHDTYFQTDTHWNCLGAFIAYQSLIDEVEKLGLPGVHRLSWDDIEIKRAADNIIGDMGRNMLHLDTYLQDSANMSCRLKERRAVQAVRIKDSFRPRDAYKPFGGSKHVRFTFERPDEQPRTRVLLIRDSFSNTLLPFLFNSFDEVTVVPRLKLTFQPRLLDQYPADLVIYEFVERALLWPVYAGKTGTPAKTAGDEEVLPQDLIPR